MLQYEAFDMLTLPDSNQFRRFCTMLQKDQLFLRLTDSPMEQMLQRREQELKTITNRFYADYKRHRESLFDQIRRDNPDVAPNELFRATQKLIDRLIFMCFARDLELVDNVLKNVKAAANSSYGQEDDKIAQELRRAFVAFDKGYGLRNIPPFNGGLFRGDPLLSTLKIRDFRLADLMDFLNSYNFQGQLNVNVLGHIFEQSISDIEDIKARLQRDEPLAGGSLEPVTAATVSKRKKEGVFYTPDYITRYIVEQAVGGWLDDREADILRDLGLDHLPDLIEADYASIKLSDKGHYERNDAIALHVRFWEDYQQQLEAVRVLDPACGSGAFLTQVFDFLWERWRVLKEETYKLATPYDQQLKNLAARSGQSIGLTARPYREWEIKKNIVSRNIYGVDLNPESVEITKLALWLKTASKSETLANLDDHIRQGNSLVSDPAVTEHAFNWDTEFEGIRFDVVVGNPPYVRQELIGREQKDYLTNTYTVGNGTADLYVYFYGIALTLVRGGGGHIGYITPNKFMKAGYGKPLRQHLSEVDLRQIIDFGELPVFADAATFPTIILARKLPPTDIPTLFAKIDSLGFASLEAAIQERPIFIPQNRFKEGNWQLTGEGKSAIFDKMRANSVLLNEYVNGAIQYGIKTGFNEAFVIDRATRDRLITEDPNSTEVIKPFIVGDNVRNYRIDFAEKYLIFIPWHFPLQDDNTVTVSSGKAEESFRNQFPAIYRHLLNYKPQLEKRNQAETGIRYEWYALQRWASDYYENFEKTKLIYPVIAKEPRFSLDVTGAYCNDKAFIIPADDTYLLALLNSKLIWFYLKSVCSVLGDEEKGGRLELRGIYLRDVPIAKSTPSQRNELTQLAEQMLALSEQLQTMTTQMADMLQTNFNVPKLTDKLLHWPNLDWPGLLTELAKQKIGVSLPKQMEWKPFYEEQRAKATVLLTTRTTTDHRIDQLVYDLYGLTEAEISVVEGR